MQAILIIKRWDKEEYICIKSVLIVANGAMLK